MNISAAALLRKLGSGVVPTVGFDTNTIKQSNGLGGSGSASSIGGTSFADLLAKAGKGQIGSGLPVSLAPEAGLSLTAEQTKRLEAAADQAKAGGMSKALVVLDGQNLVLDVDARRVTAKVDASQASSMSVDGVITAAPSFASISGALGTAAGSAADAANASLSTMMSNVPGSALMKRLDSPQIRALINTPFTAS